ncbi:phosphatidate phosphatase APP1 [Catalinimonas alkaloidigena]|uniref:App1 family protein n=1 Tax=Catalinimonas alkaloidigena TaxID=1075417 RepID=UPI00240536BF|nr:App1 family protein [Catalinimonas alkaloidigena]MDF9796042.1 phosphatidate phosphatase APP1 [Catalinimonas alkaloidigena]
MDIFNLLVDVVNYPFRKLKSFIKKKLGWIGEPIILPYRGYGNHNQFFIRGRVIEDTGLSQPEEHDSLWQNLLAMIKRYSSSGISEVEVYAEFAGRVRRYTTDDDGFFIVNQIVEEGMIDDEDWQPIHFYMLKEGNVITESYGEILLTRKQAQYGVITDIDDTLLISHATNMRKKLRLMLFKNAKTRLPFDGVAAFYCALERGTSNSEDEKNFNPFFYVSSSEWNLYDLLADFCYHHNLPKGPFLLREVKINLKKIWKSGGGNHDHKLDKIRHILSLHEEREFILIGDSGQHDAEIYKQIVHEYPERIKTIYIRDVHPKRHDFVYNIAKELAEYDTRMLLVKDTEVAAIDAIKNGYLPPKALKGIVDEKTFNKHMASDFQMVFDRMVNQE